MAHALESLLTLRLVERSEGGQLTQRAAVVSTGAQTASMHIGNYHRAMLKRAAEAIEGVPAARRDISSLTLRVREASIPQLKARLARFRRELLELEECENDGYQVLQLNMQLFPLTSGEQSRVSTWAAGRAMEKRHDVEAARAWARDHRDGVRQDHGYGNRKSTGDRVGPDQRRSDR